MTTNLTTLEKNLRPLHEEELRTGAVESWALPSAALRVDPEVPRQVALYIYGRIERPPVPVGSSRVRCTNRYTRLRSTESGIPASQSEPAVQVCLTNAAVAPPAVPGMHGDLGR
ncbi:hypothetical protein D9M68_343540 [compost metagenome]